jgi:hypothetical protein
MMKTKKCCRRDCNKEAVGYYIGSNFGVWYCDDHKYGKKTTDISEIRDNPERSYLWDMEI